MKRILFICTGNTCRSPMAEGMLRSLLAQHGMNHIEVRSAGIAADNGLPISSHTAAILREKGFHQPISSSALTQASMSWADVALTMTSSHKQHAIQRFPQFVDKVYTLKEYVDDDPFVRSRIAELEGLVADLHVKQALSQRVTAEERERVRMLERSLPDYDIADPFGGSLALYRQCAAEMEDCLLKLIRKLKP